MRRTGVRASVYWNFIIHQIFPEFLQPFRNLRITTRVSPYYRGFFFCFLDFCCLGFPQVSPFYGFGCVDFAPWRKLQLFPFTHCPLVSNCQQSPRVLCPRCFVPLILDHGVSFKISVSGFNILDCSNFARYFFSP